MAYQPIVDLTSRPRPWPTRRWCAARSPTTRRWPGYQIVAAARAHDRIRQLDESSRRLALEQAAGALEGGERLFVNFDPMSVYDPEVCLRNTWATARKVGIGIEQVCFEIVDADRCPDVDFLRRVIESFRAEGATDRAPEPGLRAHRRELPARAAPRHREARAPPDRGPGGRERPPRPGGRDDRLRPRAGHHRRHRRHRDRGRPALRARARGRHRPGLLPGPARPADPGGRPHARGHRRAAGPRPSSASPATS